MGQNVFVTSQDVVRAEVCVYGSKCSCGVLVRVANSGNIGGNTEIKIMIFPKNNFIFFSA